MSVDAKLATAAAALCRVPMLTKQDLALHYSVDEETIRRWVRDGKLPKPIRPNGKTPLWLAIEIIRKDLRP